MSEPPPHKLEYAPPPEPTVTQRAASGMRWSAAVTVFSRVLSLGNQVVLGWLLVQAEYGHFAAVFAIYSLIASVREASLHRLLVQRGREFAEIAITARRVSGTVNALVVVTLMAAMALLADADRRGESLLMMAILSASLLIGPYVVTLRAKLANEMRWKELSTAAVVGTLGRYGVAIAAALLGAGPLSLAAGLTASYFGEAIALRILMRRRTPPLAPFDWSLARSLFASARWLMLGNLGVALANSGDYLVLGFLVSDATLGAYFFGFQFTLPLIAVFQNGLNGVLLPAMVSASYDPNQLRRGAARALRLISATIAPAALALALTSPLLIHLVWNGRFDAAIPAAVAIAIAGHFTMLDGVFMSLLEATGRWRTRTLLLLTTGLAIPLAAGLGAWVGTAARLDLVASIAAAVATARSGAAFFSLYVACRSAGIPVRSQLREAIVPSLTLLAAVAAAYAACWTLSLAPESLAGSAVLCGAALLVFAPVASLTFGRSIIEAARLLVPHGLLRRVGLAGGAS